jgi:GH25 family lysozyme M1 (1,4-beta-N-acetylmuramidase)
MPFKLKLPAVYDYYGGEWPVVHDVGVTAEIFKATDWNVRGVKRYVDDHVDDYVQGAMDLSIRYALYHFLRPNSIYEQAMHYVETIEQLGGLGTLGIPILDVEMSVNMGGRDWSSQIKTWLDIVELHFGKKPMIYTNAGAWKFTSWVDTVLDEKGRKTRKMVYPSWCRDYPLWVASYPFSWFTDANDKPLSMPGGWKSDEWVMWQYSEKGRVNGYHANDLNVISDYGLRVLGLKIDEEEEQGQPPDFPASYRVISAPYVRIRSGPGVNYPFVAKIPYNSTVTISSAIETTIGNDKDIWGKMGDGSGWIAIRYNGSDKAERIEP